MNYFKTKELLEALETRGFEQSAEYKVLLLQKNRNFSNFELGSGLFIYSAFCLGVLLGWYFLIADLISEPPTSSKIGFYGFLIMALGAGLAVLLKKVNLYYQAKLFLTPFRQTAENSNILRDIKKNRFTRELFKLLTEEKTYLTLAEYDALVALQSGATRTHGVLGAKKVLLMNMAGTLDYLI